MKASTSPTKVAKEKKPPKPKNDATEKARIKAIIRAKREARIKALPPLKPIITPAQLISLLSPTKYVLSQRPMCGTPLQPGSRIWTVRRGRLVGHLTEQAIFPVQGWRRLLQTRGSTAVRALCYEIDCDVLSMSTTNTRLAKAPGRKRVVERMAKGARLTGPFSGLPHSDFALATLAAGLVARLAQAPKDLPLAIVAHQNWRKGFATSQVWLVARDIETEDRVLDYLRDKFRFDLRAEPDLLTTYAHVPLPQAPGRAHRPDSPEFGADPSQPATLFGQRE
jgi:hypothetical protein